MSRIPPIAVITPYYQERTSLLEQCHASVQAQTTPCLHVLVADGHPQPELDAWTVDHLRLPCSHRDIGSTPRLIGAIHAIGLGCELITFLDADNWLQPDHCATVLEAVRSSGAAFLSTSRRLHAPDGTYFADCPNTDPDRFIDTNCMTFARPAFPLLQHWVLMPSYAHLIGDRVMLDHVRRSGLPRRHLDITSVCYRCGKDGIYRQLGLPIPEGVEPAPDYAASFRRWEADGHPALI